MNRHLADRLLLGLLWACLALSPMTTTSCLLPQNDPTLPELPPEKNRPPFFVEGLTLPAAGRFSITGATCGGVFNFSATAADPDVTDLLVAEWYVDYDQASAGSQVEQQAINASGDVIRADPASWKPIPNAPGGRLNAPQTHVVELLVSDGQLINRSPQPRLIADGGVDLTYVIKNTWVVDVSCP